MRTAIFTVKETTLIIQSSEPAQLVPMSGVESFALRNGPNTVVVGPGVFKVQSANPVSVTATTGAFQVMATADDKDGDWPDPQKAMVTLRVTSKTLSQFFASGAKGL